MLYLYQSNRLEYLAKMLTTLHQIAPLQDIFAPEQIIVQSQGVRRYISQYIAQHTGIMANIHFSLPAGLTWQLMRQATPAIPELSPFSSAVMQWRLLDLFYSPRFDAPELAQAKTALQGYLHNGDWATYQLSAQLADVFDQYLVYRPQWIDAWAEGKAITELSHNPDAVWQAQLWRELNQSQTNIPHRVQLWRTLLDKLSDLSFVAQQRLPERYFVFGIATLAPMFLTLLRQIAQHRDVHIFALNPCAEYWGNVLEPIQILRLGDEVDWTIQGHPLLASMGKQGRDFFNELADSGAHNEVNAFDDISPSNSLLHSIQQHIQTLTLPETAAQTGWLKQHAAYIQTISPNIDTSNPIAQLCADDSLSIHAAHSPLRELQILKDQLLKLLHNKPHLQPHQIAVLMPHIEPYTPYIEAIFGKHSSTPLPYSVSDIKLSRHQALLDSLAQTLEVLNSRFEADKLLALLDSQLILDKHQISREDLPLLYDTVAQLNIRWGSDKHDRAEQGDENSHLFTWQQGLERMVLGFMLPEGMWQNLMAYSSHPEHIGVLSRFAHLVHLLSHTKKAWQENATVSQWCERIHHLIDELFLINTDDDRAALQQLETALATWQNETDTAHFHYSISRNIALDHIKRFLHRQDEAGFLRGGITFCSMIPMRSLPFEVICLLGMNDGNMPRNTKAAPFDLIAKHPQKGDRARRDDDRYLFLEMLMSARSVLYLSYIGKNMRTDAECAPSTLLEEIIDTVADMSGIEPKILQQQWVIHHPLQAFSQHYFVNDARLNSTRQDYAHALNQPHKLVAPFVSHLPPPTHNPNFTNLVEQTDFLHFWSNPLKYWLKNQLNWHAPYIQTAYHTEEPFLPDTPRVLSHAYTQARIKQQDFDELATQLYTQSLLPAGILGELTQQDYAIKAAQLPSELIYSPALDEQGGILTTQVGQFAYHLAHIHEIGQIIYAQQLLNEHNTYGQLKSGDTICLLLQHLIFCAVIPDHVTHQRNTHYIDLNQSYCLPAIEQKQAQEALEQWLAAYHTGQNTPLPFFPRIQLNCAKILFATPNPTWEKVLARARDYYEGRNNIPPQTDYPEVRQIYGRNPDTEPPYSSELFQHLTYNLFEVFAPSLQVLKDQTIS